jgi:hypothetical protein
MLRDLGSLYRRRKTAVLFTAVFKNPIYNYIVMTLLESTVAVLVSIVTLITSAALGVKWLVKHYFDDIKHEMKPNSGTSIKDQVTRLESRTDKIEEKLDKIVEILIIEGVKTKSSRSKKSEL